MMSVIRKYIRNVLRENFMSHTDEPVKGDTVVNNNPGCKHYGSKGIVLDIHALPDDAGKVVVYRVTNTGPSFSIDDVLEKTMDQLTVDIQEKH